MLHSQLTGLEGLEERIVVDTSERQTTYLLVGSNGSHMRLSPSAYNLLRILMSGMSFDEAAEQITRAQGRKVTPEELESACHKVADSVLQIESNTESGTPAGFWFRWRLFPKNIVARIVAPLRPAFQETWVVLLVGLAALTSGAMMFVSPPAGALSSPAFWPGYGLLLLSLIAHEIGHATACARYGAAPYDIGFTVYWIYPAFYSDVSSAWKLNRWQRVVVDLGGAYFQVAMGVIYVLLFLWFGWEACAVAFWMIVYSLVFSLNPIFRFDGYWVLADSLGVTNLGSQPFIFLRRGLNRLRGRPVEPLPWPRLVHWVLLVYTPVTLLVWSYFLGRLLPSVKKQAATYPARVSELVHGLLSGADPSSLEFQGLLTSTFLLLVIGLMVWRLGSPLVFLLVRKVGGVLRKTEDKPSSEPSQVAPAHTPE